MAAPKEGRIIPIGVVDTNGNLVTIGIDGGGNRRLFVNALVAGGTPALNTFTMDPPVSAAVGVASGTVLAANANRKYVSFWNNGMTTISLAFGANPAVLNAGITLLPGQATGFDAAGITLEAVQAISSAIGGVLGIQSGA